MTRASDHWPTTAAEAESLQRDLAPRVERSDRVDEIRLVAGADVGYDKRSERLCAGVVVLDADTLECVERVTHEDEARFPYVPGLFSFRELPPLLATFEQLSSVPDLVVCDGHGVAHPRRFGLASHLGLVLDLPSIGCAKTPFHGRHGVPGEARGSTAPILAEAPDDEVLGAVVRTRDGVKPVYVSVGHRVSLDTAVAHVLALAPRYRQPETTRLADALVNARGRGPAPPA